jgi:hypothetical protein
MSFQAEGAALRRDTDVQRNEKRVWLSYES